MEGVGARFGRTSSRYGPTTVFTGRVRKWRKKWVHVAPPSSGNSNLHHHHHHRAAANSEINGSRLLLLKWTPITPSQNNSNAVNNGSGDADKNGNSKSSAKDDVVADELPKRKFKYIPIVLFEEQRNESLEMAEDETKPIETETETDAEKTTTTDGLDEKPDINDVPMEENRAGTERQDLNESTLDLSLGLKGHDGESDSDSKTNQTKKGHLSTANSNGS